MELGELIKDRKRLIQSRLHLQQRLQEVTADIKKVDEEIFKLAQKM